MSEQHEDGPSAHTRRLNERIIELRAEFDGKLLAAQVDFDRKVSEVQAEVQALEQRQDVRLDKLASDVGELDTKVGTLVGGMREVTAQLGALATRLDTSPTGRAVVGAGAAAGVPSVLVLAWEAAKAFGWVH